MQTHLKNMKPIEIIEWSCQTSLLMFHDDDLHIVLFYFTFLDRYDFDSY